MEQGEKGVTWSRHCVLSCSDISCGAECHVKSMESSARKTPMQVSWYWRDNCRGTSIFSKLHRLISWIAVCWVQVCPAPALPACAAALGPAGGTTENRGSSTQMWVSGETWETSLCCLNLDQDLPLEQLWFTGWKPKPHIRTSYICKTWRTEHAGVEESRCFMQLINRPEWASQGFWHICGCKI